MFGNLGLRLLDNVEGPPSQCWIWVWYGERSADGSAYELFLWRQGTDGSIWGYHTIVIGTWFRPPPLEWVAQADGNEDAYRSFFGGPVRDY